MNEFIEEFLQALTVISMITVIIFILSIALSIIF